MEQGQSESTVAQIEYLLHQSAQGIHFMFERAEIIRILQEPTDSQQFFTFDNLGKVQDMLTKFIERPTIVEKQSYLERLSRQDYELLIRAYFHLVENTILTKSKVRH